MLLLILLAIIFLPVVEIYFIIRASGSFGVGVTFTLILLTGFVGAALARSQGRQVLRKVQERLAQGQLPTKSLVEGFLIFGGGLLLLTPGFVTDAMGLSMVFPGTRTLLASWALKHIQKRVQSGNVRFYSFGNPGPWSQAQNHRKPSHENIENQVSDVIDVDAQKLDEATKEESSDTPHTPQ